MKSLRKILVWTLLLGTLTLQIGVVANAMEITPFNLYTDSATANLALSSLKATVSGNAKAMSSSYSVTGTLTLQQYKDGKWVAYKTWPTESGKGIVSMCETCTVASGFKYRTKFVSNVNGEPITKYSAEKTA